MSGVWILDFGTPARKEKMVLELGVKGRKIKDKMTNGRLRAKEGIWAGPARIWPILHSRSSTLHPPSSTLHPPSSTVHPPSSFFHPPSSIFHLLLLLFLAACDNSVEPFAEGSPAHFSISGFLDTASDTQFVRVSPLRRSPDERRDLGDLLVTLESPETGDSWRMRDSLVRLTDGSTGHLFHVSTRAMHGRRYRLSLSRPAGGETRAETDVPAAVRFEIGEAAESEPGFTQTVTLAGQSGPAYRTRLQYVIIPSPNAEPVAATLSYDAEGSATSEGWEIQVRLTRDRERVLQQIGHPAGARVALAELRMHVEHLSSEWDAAAPSRIENGAGFFGSIARSSASWALDSVTVVSLGYQYRRADP
jgi:hypothetical protein